MYVKLNGEMVYLRRAVDHEGEFLESYITKKTGQSRGADFHEADAKASRQSRSNRH